MSRRCKIIVLPEDTSHADLARGFFRGRNVSERAYDLQRRWTGRNGNHAAVRRWFCEEARLQGHPASPRFGILALIDEDGQGLERRRNDLAEALRKLGLAAPLDPNEGRCLVLPMRNAETWMVWAARWKGAGCPTSPDGRQGFEPVSEANDYKRFRGPDGNALAREAMTSAYDAGKIIATLNPMFPPAGTPPALQEVLRPLSDFLHWARLE